MEYLVPETALKVSSPKRIIVSSIAAIIILFCIAIVFLPFSIFPKSANHLQRLSINYALSELAKDTKHLQSLKAEDSIELGRISARSEIHITQLPFHQSPLVNQAIIQIHSGDNNRAKKLFELVQKKTPRSYAAARGLFYFNLSENKSELALEQLDLLFRLNKSKTQEYINYLSLISDVPETGPAITQALQQHPVWDKLFMETKIKQSNDFVKLTHLLSEWSQSFPELADTRSTQQLLLKKMQDSQNFAAIKSFRTALLGQTSKNTIIYDKNFIGLYAPKPLAWSLASTGQDYAEISNQGGLSAGAKGAKTSVLASQLIFLPPGQSYELNIKAEGQFTNTKPRFRWEINCVSSRKNITTLDINSLFNRAQTLTNQFSTPLTGCPAQSLRLLALPSERLKRVKLRIDEIEIVPLNLITVDNKNTNKGEGDE